MGAACAVRTCAPEVPGRPGPGRGAPGGELGVRAAPGALTYRIGVGCAPGQRGCRTRRPPGRRGTTTARRRPDRGRRPWRREPAARRSPPGYGRRSRGTRSSRSWRRACAPASGRDDALGGTQHRMVVGDLVRLPVHRLLPGAGHGQRIGAVGHDRGDRSRVALGLRGSAAHISLPWGGQHRPRGVALADVDGCRAELLQRHTRFLDPGARPSAASSRASIAL